MFLLSEPSSASNTAIKDLCPNVTRDPVDYICIYLSLTFNEVELSSNTNSSDSNGLFY